MSALVVERQHGTSRTLMRMPVKFLPEFLLERLTLKTLTAKKTQPLVATTAMPTARQKRIAESKRPLDQERLEAESSKSAVQKKPQSKASKPRRKPRTSKGNWFGNITTHEWNGVTFASKFEKDFAQQLEKLGLKWEYEADTFYWFPPPRLYRPDFKVYKEDGSYYYVETKGFFDPESRTKMAAIKKQFPNEDIRMTFMDPTKKISKATSGKTYCEWADKHGYPWSSFCLPQDWRNSD